MTHDQNPPGKPVLMHIVRGHSKEPYVSIADLVLWLDRMSPESLAHQEMRDTILESLTRLAVDVALEGEQL